MVFCLNFSSHSLEDSRFCKTNQLLHLRSMWHFLTSDPTVFVIDTIDSGYMAYIMSISRYLTTPGMCCSFRADCPHHFRPRPRFSEACASDAHAAAAGRLLVRSARARSTPRAVVLSCLCVLVHVVACACLLAQAGGEWVPATGEVAHPSSGGTGVSLVRVVPQSHRASALRRRS